MKTIGLIGGSTWLSTEQYYRIINEEVNKKLGKSHSAKCIIYSIDFEEVMVKNWEKLEQITKPFIGIGKKLEKAGAELLIILSLIHI